MGGEEPRRVGSRRGDVDRHRDCVGRHARRKAHDDRLAGNEWASETRPAAVEHSPGLERHVSAGRRHVGGAEPPSDVDDDVRRDGRSDVDRPVCTEPDDGSVGAVLQPSVVHGRGVRQRLSGRPHGQVSGRLALGRGDGHGDRDGIGRHAATSDQRRRVRDRRRSPGPRCRCGCRRLDTGWQPARSVTSPWPPRGVRVRVRSGPTWRTSPPR